MPVISTFAHRRFLTSGILVLGATLAMPCFGQGGPSQADFAQALRPVPEALRGGTQGLPTIGGAIRPAASSNYINASAGSGFERERSTAAQHRDATVAQTKAASLIGCPAQPAADDKPMIGFKVSFEFGSAQLKPESFETLRNLGQALNGQLTDQKRFEIQGHTDAVGSLAYNGQLSTARAETVKEFLVKQMGVSAERLVVTGKAYCDPADSQDPYAAANRRVVVLNQSS